MSKAQYEILTNPNTTPAEKRDAFSYRPSWNTPLNLEKGYTHQINTMIGHFGKMGVVERQELKNNTEGFPENLQVADRNEVITWDDEQELGAAGLHSKSSEQQIDNSSKDEAKDADFSLIEKVQRFVK